MAADPNDPFAAMGGGVKLANGGWVPANHPLAMQQQMQGEQRPLPEKMPAVGSGTQPIDYGQQEAMRYTQAPAAAAPAAAAPASNPNDPFAAIGGGVQIQGGGWVPKDHPLAQTHALSAAPAAAGAAPAAGAATGMTAPGAAGAAGSLAQQTANAQTYSQTPGAAPSNNTTNQGTQDVVRNTYLDTLAKGTNVDTNDPTFRMQADAYGAAQERARRNAIDDSAQANFAEGTRGSGAQNIERRMADEISARNQGQFEAQLVGQELTSRRDEIRNALSSLGGMIDNDQRNALNRELAALDAALKRESLAQTGQLGNADLSLRDRLGTGALNIDLIRAMLQNQQAGNQLGLDYANSEFNNAYKLMFG